MKRHFLRIRAAATVVSNCALRLRAANPGPPKRQLVERGARFSGRNSNPRQAEPIDASAVPLPPSDAAREERLMKRMIWLGNLARRLGNEALAANPCLDRHDH